MRCYSEPAAVNVENVDHVYIGSWGTSFLYLTISEKLVVANLSPYTTHQGQLHLICLTYMNHTLESYRIFPYIAWILVIGFAVFTYMLTTNLQAELGDVDTSLEDIEMRIERLEQQQGV